MSETVPPAPSPDETTPVPRVQFADAPPIAPLPNYTLASVCPNCNAPVVRRACKVRCERCGFMWDCSEL